MKATAKVLDNETTVRALFVGTPAWSVWHDDRDKRTPATPTLLAIHAPTPTVLAIYVRPRRLHPSETPDTSWLPAGFTPVVWHPAISAEARRWLAHPTGQPPGIIGGQHP